MEEIDVMDFNVSDSGRKYHDCGSPFTENGRIDDVSYKHMTLQTHSLV